MSHHCSYRARWICRGDSSPPERGVITVNRGVIESVHTDREWTRSSRHDQPIDLGNSAILPGLVNAHTHLEFSSLRHPLGPLDSFSSWLRSVVASRRSRPASTRESILMGLEECRAGGTSAIGEIATQDDLTVYSSQQKVVVFRELLGLNPDRVQDLLETGEQHLRTALQYGVFPAISPHAPYSVHPGLLEGCVRLCRRYNAPLAMHLAESREELELLRTGDGPLKAMLEDFGVWREEVFPGELAPLNILETLSLAPRVLVVHGNYLTGHELDFLSQHPHMSVAYCPRTHAAMGHPVHPWLKMAARGIRVALGTDSRASNPDLNLLEEVKFLKRLHPEIPAQQLLKMATLNGAEALGQDQHLGSLTPGKQASLAVLRCSQETHSLDELLLDNTSTLTPLHPEEDHR